VLEATARWGTRTLPDGQERTQMTMPLWVAGYEVDDAGVVNNAVYVRWLEDLRTVFMRRWLSFEAALGAGLAPTLVRIELDYRAPLRFGDEAAGTLWFRDVGRAQGVIETEIRRTGEDRLCAHSLQTVCFVDMKSGRPVPIPAALAAAVGTR
jgi:acyl-CoA thioester hydrolase